MPSPHSSLIMQKSTSNPPVRWELRDPATNVRFFHTTNSLSSGLFGYLHHAMQVRLYAWSHHFTVVRRINERENSSRVRFI